jgi:hypothetical protein
MEIQAQTLSSTPRREPWNNGKLTGVLSWPPKTSQYAKVKPCP